MKSYTIPAAAFLLIIACGLEHRRHSQVEAQNAVLVEEAAKGLEQKIPYKIGEWTGTETPIENRELRVAEIVGCVSRSYSHDVTGETAKMALMCGSPGPISVHTPDICFEGNGYEMISEPRRITVPLAAGGDAEFWWADFQRGSVGERTTLRTFWSWNGENAWRIADHPRLEFAACPILYKLYVACPVSPTETPAADKVNTEFLQSLLGELDFIPSAGEPDVPDV